MAWTQIGLCDVEELDVPFDANGRVSLKKMMKMIWMKFLLLVDELQSLNASRISILESCYVVYIGGSVLF